MTKQENTSSASISHQSTSTPSRPVNRSRQVKSSPQVPTTQQSQKRNNNSNNNRGGRRGNFPNGQHGQHKHESALTKKFREAAQGEQAAVSESAIVEDGLATPPTTPGPSDRNQFNTYASDSAVGFQTDGSQGNKKKKGKKNRRRPTDIHTNGIQNITPPQETVHTPPDDILLGKPTPNKAYAGACFHSSPAPTALPMPKFLSKSVPSTSEGLSLSKMVAEAEAAGIPDASSSSPPQTAPLPHDDHGALGPLFKAAKEEKARKALTANYQNSMNGFPFGSTPSNDSKALRNITPPSAALPNGLGSPFGEKKVGREDQENADLLFNLEFPDMKKSNSPRPAEEVVIGQRFRPFTVDPHNPMTLVKRQEKAQALRLALLNVSQPLSPKHFEIDGPPSPSPKPKAKNMAAEASNPPPFSPTFFERSSGQNNVGFAPAPRVRHFNQNRPVNPRSHGQQHRNTRPQPFSPSGPNPFQPRDVSSPGRQPFDPARAQLGEVYLRGALKLDSPIPAL